ncbi:Bug family tripartite tricarboxylate transporter substrate binding protein [Falsiroseomonas oryziterrae]|uniref:Bug family tripartite tricarboxylate transporter substrate binding protein n=1 Tax=Falsiroseomonas oryziterrae TaxID=2911368 RepID=UPI001F2FFF2E|nr:tripartite tricarboxylate transporter substrate-binding protein [Roseomonas sp. NPKOSM-4]
MKRRAFVVAALAVPAVARAQADFATRQVRIVVPFPAGGGLDALARGLAERLQPVWRQPVVVDNRPGGATVPGSDIVAKAAPDGHTLLITADNSITSNPHLIRAMPFDPMRDLAPISHLVDVHQMVVVNARLGVGSMAELVAATRARPGALNFASYGNASQPHLAFGALAARERLELVHVPYRGLPPAVLATVQGETQMTLTGIPTGIEHIRAGTLRALAIGRETRAPQLPEVPTLAEAGFAEIDPRTWFGAFAPAGTPPGLLARLQADIAAAIADPAVRTRFVDAAGFTLHARTPEATTAFLREDLAYKGRLIAAAGIQAE